MQAVTYIKPYRMRPARRLGALGGDRRMPKVIDTNHLLEVTVRIFGERGYLATTTQEIAQAAGVNEVTLFRRYQSKASLISAALTHCLARSPFAQLSPSDDVHADLSAIVRAYIETNRAYSAPVLALLYELSRHPELQQATAILQQNLANAATIIAAHQAQGRIRPGHPAQILSFLIAPLMAIRLWTHIGGQGELPLDPDEIVRTFLDGHRA